MRYHDVMGHQKFKQQYRMWTLLLGLMPSAVESLDLSEEQFNAFCDAEPDGSKLVQKFQEWLKNVSDPKNHFKEFMVEVLSKTPHPVNP